MSGLSLGASVPSHVFTVFVVFRSVQVVKNFPGVEFRQRHSVWVSLRRRVAAAAVSKQRRPARRGRGVLERSSGCRGLYVVRVQDRPQGTST